MRVCPLCKLALRGNDPGGCVRVMPGNDQGVEPGFYAQVCSECLPRHLDGFLAHEIYVEVYRGSLSGPRPAADGTYGQIPPSLCGVCRRCAREDDTLQGLRLWREDLDPEEATRIIPEGQEHAHYIACGECRRQYAPAILRRLKDQGLVPEALTAGQMGAAHFV